MLRSIVGWLLAAPVLVAMLLAGCSNDPATPTVDRSVPLATEAPPSTPTLTPTPVPTPTPTLTPTPASPDRDALVALYEATRGPNWTYNWNWLSDRPLSKWYGVTTDVNGRVTELNLHDNQLRGWIPRELGSLSSLESLDLSDNQLSGRVKRELGNLSSLESLNLHDNQL